MSSLLKSNLVHGEDGTKPRRWLRFSVAGLMLFIFWTCGLLGGYRFGYDRGVREGRLYRDSDAMLVRVYDVADLAKVVDVPAGESADQTVGTESESPNVQLLIEAITTTWDVESWESQGGPGTIREVYGPNRQCKLVICQNAYVHDEISRLLRSVRQRRDQQDGP